MDVCHAGSKEVVLPISAKDDQKNNSDVFPWNMVILILDYSLYT